MSAPARIGQILDAPLGKIQLKKVLGHGSFAVVYLGTHLESKRQYAVKLLFKKNLSVEQLQVQRLECELHQKVSEHPNIVTLHHVLEDDTCMYLLLDYWKHGDLFDALVSHSMDAYFVDPRNCLLLFREIIAAIEHCHENGVYHRDLKPENILLNRYHGRIQAAVGDFGLATDSAFSSDFACGSVRYMSPDCLNESLGQSSYSTPSNDVWALGVILVNLLTRKNPWCEPSSSDPMFGEWSELESQARHQTFMVQFNFSKQVSALLAKCFELDWKQRISVSELGRAVDELVDRDHPVFAPVTSASDAVVPQQVDRDASVLSSAASGFCWADDIESSLHNDLLDAAPTAQQKQDQQALQNQHQQLLQQKITARGLRQPKKVIPNPKKLAPVPPPSAPLSQMAQDHLVNTLHWVAGRIFSLQLAADSAGDCPGRTPSVAGALRFP